MKAQADKTVPTKSKAVANTDFATHETGEREVLFEDRRPETVIQKQLAEKADNSPQAGKIAQLQAVVNGANVDPVQRQESEEDEELPEERPAQLQARMPLPRAPIFTWRRDRKSTCRTRPGTWCSRSRGE